MHKKLWRVRFRGAAMLALLQFFLPAALGSACAEWTEDAELCAVSARTHAATIAACDRTIVSGRLTADEKAVTHFNRANAYSDLGDYLSAITDYDRAIKLEPNDPSAYNNRGLAYAGLGEHHRAIADYDRALALQPDHLNALTNRGVARREIGDLAGARADFQKVLTIDPCHKTARSNLAELERTGRREKPRGAGAR